MPIFRELEKRKTYKTWRYTHRRTNTVCLIHYTPITTEYHYEIYNKKENFKLSSLEDNLTYSEYEHCERDLLRLAESLDYYKKK